MAATPRGRRHFLLKRPSSLHGAGDRDHVSVEIIFRTFNLDHAIRGEFREVSRRHRHHVRVLGGTLDVVDLLDSGFHIRGTHFHCKGVLCTLVIVSDVRHHRSTSASHVAACAHIAAGSDISTRSNVASGSNVSASSDIAASASSASSDVASGSDSTAGASSAGTRTTSSSSSSASSDVTTATRSAPAAASLFTVFAGAPDDSGQTRGDGGLQKGLAIHF